MKYYWDRAAVSFVGHHPDSAGLSYTLKTTTFYRHVNKKGIVTSTDTTVARFYYSWGKFDSVTTTGTARVPVRKINLEYPNIFSTEYRLNFFPNDTGGPDLAIGFENDSAAKSTPVGLVVINRNTYQPKWLYLYYPNVAGYKRFTRSFRFTQRDNFNFPDSVWEVGAISGILTSEYYRIETKIDSISIIR
jgi:hypothetical protein